MLTARRRSRSGSRRTPSAAITSSDGTAIAAPSESSLGDAEGQQAVGAERQPAGRQREAGEQHQHAERAATATQHGETEQRERDAAEFRGERGADRLEAEHLHGGPR